MCNASTARSVVSPWSGRQMTSYLSQSEPRNTHLGTAITTIIAATANTKSMRLNALPPFCTGCASWTPSSLQDSLTVTGVERFVYRA
jgi:hypothetical protein